ncbi:hypothetical protein CEXT_407201 [Caerostris extrusa]|uniref:Uncharacterized protein n=1 Tax=Caerostris extrusa TaxID=172846 RepID=A0AAV4UPU4_CAEEX|nr:hypothetical protein CEXT_407201 [Caerostris extrusa]
MFIPLPKIGLEEEERTGSPIVGIYLSAECIHLREYCFLVAASCRRVTWKGYHSSYCEANLIDGRSNRIVKHSIRNGGNRIASSI